jgi:4-hydroxythreonine-4-phosphate dehydrogenase
MGDPAGVGAEVCVKALDRPEVYRLCRPVVVGDLGVLKAVAEILGVAPRWNTIERIEEGRFEPGSVDVIDLANLDRNAVAWGQVSSMAGEAAYAYVVRSAEVVLAGEAEALVTAPIHKEALNLAGHHYAGHTELLAELTCAQSYAMMLAVGRLRVAHVTGHVSLRDACERLSCDRVLEVIILSDQAMRRIGIRQPRVAVAALNPHAGEAGLFGREEIEQILPAIEAARQRGISAEGPLPADTMMAKVVAGGYDVAVAMYHDQGHIAVKFVGFQYDQRAKTWSTVRGVNITLGLPIIRTSVDHGTAFDLAGRGLASEQSMVDAIEWAVALAGGDASKLREGR